VRLLEYFDAGAEDGLRLHQFLRYAIDVYGLGRTLLKLTDGRRDPAIRTFDVVYSLLMAAVLRVPSLNALEGMLREQKWHQLMGHRGSKVRSKNKGLFSADTMADVLDSLEVQTLQAALVEIIKKAERNKAFRDDTFGTFRCAAIDGWEPFCTYKRHCPGCLTRQIKLKSEDEDGNEVVEVVTQYYHRFVVAFLIAPSLDLTLAIEPVRSADLRAEYGERDDGHEGELTAALRLIDRLKKDYGRFIDAFVLDGLYSCGPVFDKLAGYNYGAFVITKNKKKDPYRFAEEIWQIRDGPDEVTHDPVTKEKVEFWELDNVDALKTFDGSVKMLKAVVHRKNGKKSTWVMALLGKARRASRLAALRIMRARWHIENTAFHQWVTKWNLDHCYRHTPSAITSVMHIWSLAFNLFQLFYYRRLNKPRRGRKPNDTLAGCIRCFWMDLGSLTEPVPWHFITDTT